MRAIETNWKKVVNEIVKQLNGHSMIGKKIVWWRLEKQNARISFQLNGVHKNKTENFHDFIDYQFYKLVKNTSDLFGILRLIEDVKMQPPINFHLHQK